MIRPRLVPAVTAPLLIALALGQSSGAGHALAARGAVNVTTCSGITIGVLPGLNPPVHNQIRIAADSPRGPFSVPLPVYPGTTTLSTLIATPYPEYPATPYLHTGAAEFEATGNVKTWAQRAFPACGWRSYGSWHGNSSPFSNGLTFHSRSNDNLTVEVSFGSAPSGATYIGYGVEEIVYPPRPARSYLRGPFTRVNVAVQYNATLGGHPSSHVAHGTLESPIAIRHLVHLINAVRGFHRASVVCVGGFVAVGPAWLSFVRPDGSVVHAFESYPGPCGGLAVNGARWLIDPGGIMAMAKSIAPRAAAGR